MIGDIYGQYGLSTAKNMYGRAVEFLHRKMDRMASECDTFGLATRNMAEALPGDRQDETKEKTIFYAGALLNEYGIDHLLNAFALIDDPTYRLVIAGGGDVAREVEQAAGADSRINYLGFITPTEVQAEQNMATVLVNPRQSGREHVKYSFASKNLECLASGVPYIAHDLPCNQLEYADCILYLENETDEAFAEKIREVCSLNNEERRAIGERAYNFIRT